MNGLKERWAAGDSVVGAWSLIPDGLAAETVARAGFDFVCIDNQHGVNDYASTVHMLQVLALSSSVPLVRVPWNEPGVIGKMLDAGAHGIVVPMVNSAEEAEAAVRACRYPPDGARSYGPVAAGMRTVDYATSANEAITCIPMIETVAAVDALDAILALEGVD
ncbi:MAG: HpcH/HpaI aldolase family protein, partial [Gaiellaceae bacterium]